MSRQDGRDFGEVHRSEDIQLKCNRETHQWIDVVASPEVGISGNQQLSRVCQVEPNILELKCLDVVWGLQSEDMTFDGKASNLAFSLVIHDFTVQFCEARRADVRDCVFDGRGGCRHL